MVDWRTASMHLTFALLVGSVALVAAGTLGLASGPLLVALLTLLAAGLVAVRDTARRLDRVSGWDVGGYLAVAWVGPAVGAVVAVLFLGASPGEVQALGGLVGLAAMANYFLRPVYYLVVSLGRWVANAAGG